jgi:aspartyl-tRNA(Asn)/glutamyl-tRNA(Gln) amidotransferase subunit B
MEKNTIYNTYEAVIGIEIHVQLNTKEKIFCYCKNESGKEPNTNICPICCGYPGTLPLLNPEVIQCAIMAGLATNCQINKRNVFSRKHYFYADLPKGYQISQNDKPICEYGSIEITTETKEKKNIGIRRIHMEEDAGKNIHTENQKSLVNLNRAGTPLLEIVSQPDIRSAHEAVEYLKTIHGIMITLGITSGNMEDGAFRADTNISVRKKGEIEFGIKCELKNINSFKFIKDATTYEIQRQIDLIESGEKIVQQTRLWDTKLKQTYAMRNKETSQDYRYLDDPDLTPVIIEEETINTIRTRLPELPVAKKNRFMNTYLLSEDDAFILTSTHSLAQYFETAYSLRPSKLIANWILRELLGTIKEKNIEFEQNTFTPEFLAELVTLLEEKKITQKIARDIFLAIFETHESPLKYAIAHNLLGQSLSDGQIEKIISEILDTFPDAKEELKNGKMKARGFLIGKIMEKTAGKADPKTVNIIFDQQIKL